MGVVPADVVGAVSFPSCSSVLSESCTNGVPVASAPAGVIFPASVVVKMAVVDDTGADVPSAVGSAGAGMDAPVVGVVGIMPHGDSSPTAAHRQSTHWPATQNPFGAKPSTTAPFSRHADANSGLQLIHFVLAARQTHSSASPFHCAVAPPWHVWSGSVVVVRAGTPVAVVVFAGTTVVRALGSAQR